MKKSPQELVQRTGGRGTGSAGNDVLDGLFGRSEFDAANDTEERMAA